MHFPRAMRRPRHAAPLVALVVLLLCCAGGCRAAAPVLQQRCGFDEMMRRSGPLPIAVVREVPRRGQGAMRAYTVATQDDSSDWAPIRIKVFTEDLSNANNRRNTKRYCERVGEKSRNYLGEEITCTEKNLLTNEKKTLYENTIIPGAVKLHAERLLVKPETDKITVPTSMGDSCAYFTIPVNHKKKGVPDADFIIYAAAGPSGSHGRPVWAATCVTLTDLRPSIGAMNFDPEYMTEIAWSVRAAAHEIAHALGFSKEAMDEKNMMEKSKESVRGRLRNMVVGSSVKRKAKLHFGCDSLKGMELEDEASSHDVKIPHWKERHARDELMAPTVGAGYYTALTLAVFADLGYYRVNWSMAEPMSWGNRTGCDFVNKKCSEVENLSTKHPRMFCDATDNTTLRCTSDRRHVGTCTARLFEQRGSVSDKDICPGVSSYFHTASSGTTYNTCSDEKVTFLPGSLTGSDSWCLDAESLVVKNKENSGHKNVAGVCAQVSCEAGKVKVKYLGSETWHECPDGGDIEVKSNEFQSGGKIKCPKYGEVCTIAANGSSLVIPSALEDAEEYSPEKIEKEAGAAPSPAAKHSPGARETSLRGTSGAAGGGVGSGQEFAPQLRAENGDDAEEQGQGRGSVGTGDGANGALNPNADPPPSAGVASSGEGVAPAGADSETTDPTVAGGAARQAGNDGGVAAAGLSSLVLLAAATAAVAMVPL